ncbi:phosphorothioated DNA-binding restriction endonuclease [Sphaerimonospora sp. CA-214678]|uniref:phosphorothioated DNA-binding restriction endonuclease n=1 Tax=Sphaerimonospora sp. CA-214678 TaxID=3240029 RepID=UPI003D8C9408
MDWVERVTSVNQWSRGGERAPHKPLLLLYALGCFQRQGGRPIPFSAAEADLKRLLQEFGPPRKTSPGYPFHHLTRDGIWLVETAEGPGSPGSELGRLRDSRAAGRLHPDLVRALHDDSRLVAQIARALLDANFEPSLHPDICLAAGLDLTVLEATAAGGDTRTEVPRTRRNPAFREQVLTAYEYCCAFCGYDGWLDGIAIGLDAAHVRWWAFEGPDEPANGLCLCALHHKLFDKGVFGLTHDLTISVSREFVGRTPTAREMVLSLAGRPVREPQPGLERVEPEYIDWHNQQVFRSPARLG